MEGEEVPSGGGRELRVRIFGNFPIGRAEKMFSEDSSAISNHVC